jgi:hypothetical protein
VRLRGLQFDVAVKKGKDEMLAAMTNVWRALTRRSVLAHPTIEVIDVSAAGIAKLEPITILLQWPYSEGTQYGTIWIVKTAVQILAHI